MAKSPSLLSRKSTNENVAALISSLSKLGSQPAGNKTTSAATRETTTYTGASAQSLLQY
jgi:hypothetical protein